MRVTCDHCGEVFEIGEDAFVVTDEDKFRSLRQADAGVLIIGRLTRKPDMVMHWTRPTTEDERTQEQQRATEIADAIARGERRQWWCGKCHNETPNAYA